MTLKKMSVAANDIVLNNLVMREKTFKTIPYQLCSVLLNLQFYPAQLGKTPACIFKSSSQLLCEPLSVPLLLLILWKFGGVVSLFIGCFFVVVVGGFFPVEFQGVQPWPRMLAAHRHVPCCSIFPAEPGPFGQVTTCCHRRLPMPLAEASRHQRLHDAAQPPSSLSASLPGPQAEMHFCSCSSGQPRDFLELLHIWSWERGWVWRASSLFPWRNLFPILQDLCPFFPFLFLANLWI